MALGKQVFEGAKECHGILISLRTCRGNPQLPAPKGPHHLLRSPFCRRTGRKSNERLSQEKSTLAAESANRNEESRRTRLPLQRARTRPDNAACCPIMGASQWPGLQPTSTSQSWTAPNGAKANGWSSAS